MNRSICRIHHLRSTGITRVIFRILEDRVSCAEHLHILYFRTRILGVRTNMPVRQVCHIGFETEHRLLVNHRAQCIRISLTCAQEVGHYHQVILIIMCGYRCLVFRCIAVYISDIIVILQIRYQIITRSRISCRVRIKRTIFRSGDDKSDFRSLPRRIDTNRSRDLVRTSRITGVFHRESHRHIQHLSIIHFRSANHMDVLIEKVKRTSVNRSLRINRLQLILDTRHIIIAGQFHYAHIHMLSIPDGYSRRDVRQGRNKVTRL